MKFPRTIDFVSPRESIYWSLDLIEDYPLDAIQAMKAYYRVYGVRIPVSYGIFDCIDIIRARCKEYEAPTTALEKISSFDFEHFVERLCLRMGYVTTMTPKTRDGGFDIKAEKTESGSKITVIIDAKKWKEIDEPCVRTLLGAVLDKKASKGVIVTNTTTKVTSDARKFEKRNAHQVEILSGEDLIVLLNEQFGTNWPDRVDWYVAESKRAHKRLL